MDKVSANFLHAVQTMRDKLDAEPLIMQIPIGHGKEFVGVVDLVEMKKLTWNASNGVAVTVDALSSTSDPDLFEEAVHYRTKLIEQLADLDETIANYVLEDAKFDEISPRDIKVAVRKASLSLQAVPTFCGSSFKNKGVEPLLDAIINYLPNPAQIKHDFVEFYKYVFAYLMMCIITPIPFLHINLIKHFTK